MSDPIDDSDRDDESGSAGAHDEEPVKPAKLSPRLLRAVELVYALEGVVAVRLWEWPGTIALGIATTPPGDSELLRRAESITGPLREAGERWELGLLDDGFDRATP